MSRTPILVALSVALTIALLALVYLVARGTESPAPVGPDTGGAPPSVAEADPAVRAAPVAERVAPPDAADPGETGATRIEVDRGTVARATIRGRCVDEAGEPLIGVAVALNGWGANTERMDRYRLDHGEVEWTNPEDVITGADGRFEHRFDPPPPYQFTCEASAAGRVPVYGRWSEIEPTAAIDMGDVVLRVGVEVVGRLVDESGVGIAKKLVSLRPGGGDRGDPFGALRPRDSTHAGTDAAGFFSARTPLPEGRYSVRVEDLVVREPQGEVELAPPRADLRIVASAPPPDERPTIEGVVVDARGAPVAGAQIVVGGNMFSGPTTRRDGTFVARPEDGLALTAVALGVDAAGFVPWSADEPVDWGTRDLRVTLVDGPPMTVVVQRADDGSPVERFGILLAPIRENRGWSSRDNELRHLGEHPGGVLALPRVTTGRFRFAVVPAESIGLPPSPDREIEIEVGVPVRLDVQIAPIVARVVEVVTTRGDPVRGARVELLWYRGGGEVTLGMTAMGIASARINSPDHVAVLVDDATTAADGRVTLRGPTDVLHVLRLPGPGHVPALVAPFDLAGDGPARVVVGAGGRVVGRVEPIEVLASLRAEAGLPAEGPVDARLQDQLPGVRLSRDGPGGREHFPSGRGESLPLGTDGRFEIDGVPPGTWNVHVRSYVAIVLDGRSVGGSNRSVVAAAGVTFAEGEERELVLDLSTWRRHPVTFRVRLDGEPFRGSLELGGTLASSGAEHMDYRSLGFDGGEEVVAALPAGSWTTSARVRIGETWTQLPGPAFVVGPSARGPTHVEIALSLGCCAVVVVDPDGEPAAGVVLLSANEIAGVPTDGAGRTVLYGPVGPVDYRTRRRPLAQDQAYYAWVKGQPRTREAQERAWIDLGVIELVPGASSAPRTIRLPAEWGELPK